MWKDNARPLLRLPYFDLEQEPERLRLNLQWPELVAGADLLILDEVQTWPEIFPRLRGSRAASHFSGNLPDLL